MATLGRRARPILRSARPPTAAQRRGPARAPSARGRASVMEALLDAATELLAARGPAAVSVREIASRAGVNQGLLHRHSGSKEALLRSVLERLTRRLVPRGPLDASPAAGLQLVAAEAATAAHY